MSLWVRVFMAWMLCLPAAGAAERVALLLELSGAVGPATANYIERGIERAQRDRAELVVIRVDTPGGLDASMRTMIKAITASPVPVVVWVAPSGARAASAGTYILYTAHVAAMAPGTNLGAATPVQLGGLPEMDESKEGPQKADEPAVPDNQHSKRSKLVNDAVAYLRSLAELRGRNADWAEQAVREAASASATEALELGVIDLIAGDRQGLLQQLDGRRVDIGGKSVTLQTQELQVVELSPDWRSELLAVIANPNVAYILMLVGIYGLIYEFANPGALVPGIAGAICLMLALYAFQVLPVNYAGAALILLGLLLLTGEAFVPSFGALGIGGIIAFVVGSLILIDSEAPGFAISLPLILGTALSSALIVILVIRMALMARRRPVVSGAEQLLGESGQALEDFDGHGSVRVHGEVWSAVSAVPVQSGQRVRVLSRDGLVLSVEPSLLPQQEELP